MFNDVGDFYEKFKLPQAERPALLDNQQQLYRLARMLEELHEFQAAHLNGDLVKAADALADLAYFTLGTAVQMGLPFHTIWRLVHESNMAKVRADHFSASKYGDGADIVKPQHWVSPNEAIKTAIQEWIDATE